MSLAYRAVGWNRQKQRYDGAVLAPAFAALAALALGLVARRRLKPASDTP